MKIFLWSQDKTEQLQVEHLIWSYLDSIGEENFDVIPFSDTKGLYKECLATAPTVAFFILPQENPLRGLQVARHFQEISGGRIPFVLVGHDRQRAFDAYEMGAAYYIQLPVTFAQMATCYDRCLTALGGASKQLRVTCQYKTISIPFHRLMFIREEGKEACIYVEGQREPIAVYTSIKALRARLTGRRFISPYRGYIVNMDFVENIEGESIYMADGTLLPCKKRGSSKIQACYHEYLLNRTLPHNHAVVELVRYRDRLRVVLQSASICVFEVDIPHQTYTFFDNAEAIFGISGKKILKDVREYATLPPEQYRKRVTEYFSRPEDEEVIKEAFQKIFAGKSASYEAYMKAGTTKFVHCQIDVMPIMRDGIPVRMVGLIKKLDKM